MTALPASTMLWQAPLISLRSFQPKVAQAGLDEQQVLFLSYLNKTRTLHVSKN
jgi:hypothetical protein